MEPRVHSMAEVLAAHLSPETSEHAYRRGYRDGWIMAIEGIVDAMAAGYSCSDACRAAVAHRDGRLTDWVRSCRLGSESEERRDWPPEMIVRKRARRGRGP
jgi:hypothetical protein